MPEVPQLPLPLAALPPLPGMTQESALALLSPLDSGLNALNSTLASMNSAASSLLSGVQAPFRTASPAPVTQPLAALQATIKEQIGKLPAGQSPAARKQTDAREHKSTSSQGPPVTFVNG
jgi:hypothetical protein